jgi:hypothetical protein
MPRDVRVKRAIIKLLKKAFKDESPAQEVRMTQATFNKLMVETRRMYGEDVRWLIMRIGGADVIIDDTMPNNRVKLKHEKGTDEEEIENG